MLGFSNGGLPNGPSIVGLLIFKMHFLKSYNKTTKILVKDDVYSE